MAIIERDPWRLQYFENISCPAEVTIPTDDETAYVLFPESRWIYNKILIAETQGIHNGPHGTHPAVFPIFSKPIYNLHGMGLGSRVFLNREEYEANYAPGHFRMELLEGEHVSTDALLIDGEPRWWKHVTGVPGVEGTFKHWTIHKDSKPTLEDYCGAWTRKHLRGYTGMINLETIGGKIIEAQLRFADQWPDLYGDGWIQAMVDLYAYKRWNYHAAIMHDGYSVILFGPHRGEPYSHPPQSLLDEIRKRPAISSVQITFHEDKPAVEHAMPPGGFRLAVINCWDLIEGERAKKDLAEWFGIEPVN